MVFETVERIRSLIDQAAELQEPYVRRICPRCEDPCCARVHYLFTEKDIIYLKLSGRQQTWRRQGAMKKGCWFLSDKGCTLSSDARPFICHSYLCEDLKSAMTKDAPALLSHLREIFKEIGMLRGQMWTEYLEEARIRDA